MVRYADDTVFCFQYEEDAKEFYSQMKQRLGNFKLEVAEEKTKIISLNKDDDDDKGNDDGGCKQTSSFDFLGFTHYMGEDKNGVRRVKRKTSKKKYRASLHRCKEWIRKNRHMPTKSFMKKMKVKLQGHIRYYGITDNRRAVSNFIDETKRLIYKWLNRRSQRKSFDWDKFNLFLKKYPLPRGKTYVRLFELGMGRSYVL